MVTSELRSGNAGTLEVPDQSLVLERMGAGHAIKEDMEGVLAAASLHGSGRDP